MSEEARIKRVAAQAFRIPTDAPEADGTIRWDATTLVLVTVEAGGAGGMGYSYADAAAAEIVASKLADVLRDQNALAIPRLWSGMVRSVRNIGWRGICACAISAVDVALWDLKARLLNVPLVELFGAERSEVPIYGSGGFTSYRIERLRAQLAGWVEQDGCRWVKMKVGAEPSEDPARVRAARDAIGKAGLYVDANGAYDRKQALKICQ